MCVTQIHNSAHAFFQIWVYSITQLPRKLRCCLAATSLISHASRTTHLTDLCKSSLRLKKPTTQVCSSISRKENPKIRSPDAVPHTTYVSKKSPTRRLRFLTSRSSSWSTRRPNGLVVHRSTWPENLVVIRRHTHLHAPPGFPVSPSCAGGLSTRLPRTETLLLTSSLHVSSHVSPRHVISHVSDTS